MKSVAPPIRAQWCSNSVDRLRSLMSSSNRPLVITGAGISTESGIPDYRSEHRPQYSPITIQAFINSQEARRRYWARSYTAHMRQQYSQPNLTHITLRQAIHDKPGMYIITQNVDGLHGDIPERIIELHGSLRQVVCMECGYKQCRRQYQQLLKEKNPSWKEFLHDVQAIRPDGDFSIPDGLTKSFVMCFCQNCKLAEMRPDFVFFGENVKAEVSQQASDLVDQCDSVLILGTTLSVFSASNESGDSTSKIKDLLEQRRRKRAREQIAHCTERDVVQFKNAIETSASDAFDKVMSVYGTGSGSRFVRKHIGEMRDQVVSGQNALGGIGELLGITRAMCEERLSNLNEIGSEWEEVIQIWHCLLRQDGSAVVGTALAEFVVKLLRLLCEGFKGMPSCLSDFDVVIDLVAD